MKIMKHKLCLIVLRCVSDEFNYKSQLYEKKEIVNIYIYIYI